MKLRNQSKRNSGRRSEITKKKLRRRTDSRPALEVRVSLSMDDEMTLVPLRALLPHDYAGWPAA